MTSHELGDAVDALEIRRSSVEMEIFGIEVLDIGFVKRRISESSRVTCAKMCVVHVKR